MGSTTFAEAHILYSAPAFPTKTQRSEDNSHSIMLIHLKTLASVLALASSISSAPAPTSGNILGSGDDLLGSHFGLPGNQIFDYVVVGGGTAGLAIATRLAEDSSVSVAIIEAGSFYEIGNGNLSQIPLFGPAFSGKSLADIAPLVDWAFHTTPQTVRCDNLLKSNKPSITLQTCTDGRSLDQIGAQQIADHTRMPVYFEQAIERLALTLGPSTWLEAGSSSSVTAMASRALSSSITLSHTFQAIALGGTNATGSLVDATLNLWKSGHKVHFWPHHRSQKYEYQMINLPPYQFEKSRHWLSWVDTTQTFTPVDSSEPVVEKERALLSLIGFRDKDRLDAEFSVDPLGKEYKFYVRGHAVLAEPLCPAPLYVELVSRAAMSVLAEAQSTDYLPSVQDLEISAPLGMNTDRAISVEMKRTDGKSAAWTFELKSKSRSDTRESSSTHATGRVTLHRESPRLHTELSRYERLIGYQKCDDLRLDPRSEILQGATVYKAFSRVVTYAEDYKGVRSVYGQGQQVAGLVSLPDYDQSALQKPITRPLAVDNFVQVAGLHVSCLNDCKDTQVYVCTQVESIQIGPKFKDSNSWFVYSSFTSVKDRDVSNDIFVFDRESKNLVLIVLGARFMKVLISSLTKVLSRANPSQGLA